MHEPPKSKHLPNNPYAIHGGQGGPEAQALLALAWEIRTLTMLEHPHVGHEAIDARLKGATMSDHDNLRDRIADIIERVGNDWDAQMMSSIVDDKPQPPQPLADTTAQAIIDELGLTVETQSLRWMDPNGPFPQERVVGKWEDKATKNRVELRTIKRDGRTVHQAIYVDDPESYWHDISIVRDKR